MNELKYEDSKKFATDLITYWINSMELQIRLKHQKKKPQGGVTRQEDEPQEDEDE